MIARYADAVAYDIPEPPDGTRIEFVFETDVYAAWRNDASSVVAGWADAPGDGGATWCVYPDSCPRSWASMIQLFGETLRDAVRLVPIFEEIEPAPCGCPVTRRVATVLRHTRRCSDKQAAQRIVTDSGSWAGTTEPANDF